MARRIDQRLKMKRSTDDRRTDRVKKAERERMVKLHDKGMTIEGIAYELKRSERTVSKQLKKASTPEQTSTTADPLVLQRKAEHFAYMAEIANGLLATTYHPLDSVRKNPDGEGEYGEYLLGSDDDAWPVNRQDLRAWLQKNVDIASGRDYPAPGEYEAIDNGCATPLAEFKVYPDYDFECLTAHLKEECRIVGEEGLDKAVQQDPYAVIDAVRLASRRKTFKGKCEVCKDW
jgi:hypothetical protein